MCKLILGITHQFLMFDYNRSVGVEGVVLDEKPVGELSIHFWNRV